MKISEIIREMTSAGCVASVSVPLGDDPIRRREKELSNSRKKGKVGYNVKPPKLSEGNDMRHTDSEDETLAWQRQAKKAFLAIRRAFDMVNMTSPRITSDGANTEYRLPYYFSGGNWLELKSRIEKALEGSSIGLLTISVRETPWIVIEIGE